MNAAGVTKDRSRRILPRAIQEQVKTFPKRNYALRHVVVRLKDGTEHRGVLVTRSSRNRLKAVLDLTFDALPDLVVTHVRIFH